MTSTAHKYGLECCLSATANRLYEAEVALHGAHQSHEDAWIAAAGDKLHDALVDYMAARHELESWTRRRARGHSVIRRRQQPPPARLRET